MPARGARLAGRVPAVHDGQLAPVPFRFVAEEGAELRPPGAADRFGQRPVADHAAGPDLIRRPHTARSLHGSDMSKRNVRPCSPIHPRPELNDGAYSEDHGNSAGRCVGDHHAQVTASRSYRPSESGPSGPASGRCVGELPQRGAKRSGGFQGGRPPRPAQRSGARSAAGGSRGVVPPGQHSAAGREAQRGVPGGSSPQASTAQRGAKRSGGFQGGRPPRPAQRSGGNRGVAPPDYNGMLPCFLGGSVWRLVRSARRARVTSERVSACRMTASR